MPNAILSWLRRRRVARSSKKQRPLSTVSRLLIGDPVIPPHPKLPPQRSGRLTPSPSHESLAATSEAATANSAFFTRLPAEIRRKILVEAFGGQTVHMDLIYDHPPQPPPPSEPEPEPELLAGARPRRHREQRAHGNFNVNVAEYSCDVASLRLDDSQPKEWAWRSSVCHRNPPFFNRPCHAAQPAEDYCRFGQSPMHLTCHTWPGEFPTKCHVGAMGWLRSCRQAYIEGIDVLYSTNTIHTASKEMILSLPSILLPQRLASITSVELLWEFAPFPSFHPDIIKPPLSDMASFHRFLDAVQPTFPALRKLHISLMGRLFPTKKVDGSVKWDSNVKRVDEILLPVDDLFLKLKPGLQDSFSLGIPSSLYKAQRDQAISNKNPVEQDHLGQQERHWRPLKSEKNNDLGYWVFLGKKDIRMPYVCTMGEGGYDRIVGKENWVLYSF